MHWGHRRSYQACLLLHSPAKDGVLLILHCLTETLVIKNGKHLTTPLQFSGNMLLRRASKQHRESFLRIRLPHQPVRPAFPMDSKRLTPTNSRPEYPLNLLDFHRMFRDEASCLPYLEGLRWPGDFICEKCSASGEPIRIATRPSVLKCRSCLYQSSVTSGTVRHQSKTNLHRWFWAAYLIATQTPGISKWKLQKRLGIACYETVFQLLHKLRAAIILPVRNKIGAECLLAVVASQPRLS